MIGIIDYGMGNLGSVGNALTHLGVPYMICENEQQILQCDKLILPGVGAFAQGMENLKEKGLDKVIQEAVQNNVPLLGICLGMQMLFETSEEKGFYEGFGFIQGKVIKIEEDLPVPEIGWNQLVFNQDSPFQHLLTKDPYVYYVHSYYASVTNDDDLIAYSEYGHTKVAGIVQKGNVLGTQFHPEKSGEQGLLILKYFVEEFI